MTTPLETQILQPVINDDSTSSVVALVHHMLLEIAPREVMDITAAAQPSTPSVDPKTPITDIGDYLTQAAFTLFRLTDKLVIGPHVEEAAVNAHEQAKKKNHVSELTPLVVMDLEIQKLR